jgi:NAD(P)H-dependent FMN reductase
MTSRLLLIPGSTRRRSTHTATLHTVREVIGGDVAAVYDGLVELPAFNPAHDGRALPAAVIALREAIAAADAVVFCTPEYAGRVPDSLRNLLNWTVGRADMHRKPASWINVVGPECSDVIDAAVAHSLRRVGAMIMPSSGTCIPVSHTAIDRNGLIADALARTRLTDAFTTIFAELGRPPARLGPARRAAALRAMTRRASA